jgi:hypothetical protein
MTAAGLVAAASECLWVVQCYRRLYCALELIAWIGNDYILSIISRQHTWLIMIPFDVTLGTIRCYSP